MTAERPTPAFGSLTTDEAEAALRHGTVLLLPIGSLEAHGPHLPLDTDVIIARETARRARALLVARGIPSYLLPHLAYARADCAAAFPGTVSLAAEAVEAQLDTITRALAPPGGPVLCLVNAHLEPDHIRALQRAVERGVAGGCRAVFPDQTRRPHVDRLGEEFRRGGGHAGGYETSLVMAAGGRVEESIRLSLPPNPVDLAAALRTGSPDFRALGGPRAYFGDPAAATCAEGERLYGILASIVADAAAVAIGT